MTVSVDLAMVPETIATVEPIAMPKPGEYVPDLSEGITAVNPTSAVDPLI
ncbi:MAG: hypothetical protein V2A74_03815 [bacterium]